MVPVSWKTYVYIFKLNHHHIEKPILQEEETENQQNCILGVKWQQSPQVLSTDFY